MAENNTKEKKVLRFFVSSVGKVMCEERRTLRDLIWKSGHYPIAMEGFWGNHAQTSIDVVIENLRKADVIIIVLGFTYGALIGNNLSCLKCPIKNTCTEKKHSRKSTCSISYTHFEYLYAKQENIRRYCIIQKDVDNVERFQERLNALRYNAEERKRLLGQYSDQRSKQLELIDNASQKWSSFYDVNEIGTKVDQQIMSLFSKIITDISNDDTELYGLVDGRNFTEALQAKNKEIEGLNKELNETAKFYRNEISKKTSPVTAVTGTCIPFKYKKDTNTIITYLISNSAYTDGNRLMFPGGHAFINDESPEDIAMAKAKIEAGLIVRPIDIYKNFDMLPIGKSSSGKDSQFSPGFRVYRPPHYSYLFVQKESAKCYREKNHLYHYDAVYVCEINEVLPEDQCAQKRVKIELPRKAPTLISTKQCLESSVEEKRYLDDSFDDYIIKMLYEAYKDYVDYLNTVSEDEGAL